MNGLETGLFELIAGLAGIHELSQLFDSFGNLAQSAKNIMSAVGVIMCIIGLLQCFFGYKLFKIWCAVVGFIFGALIAFAITATGVFVNSSAPELISILLFVFLGLLGALIAYKLYIVGLFIYAFVAAFFIGFILFAVITNSLATGLGAGLIAGLAVGIIAVIFRRFWIILTTSVSGGVSINNGLIMILQTTALGYLFIIPPVLAIIGFFVQYLTERKHPSHSVHVHGQYPVYQSETAVGQPHDSSPAHPPESPQAAAAPVNYSCPNCGYAAVNNTAPCNNCGSAVQQNPGL